jgi:hypothetical protein
MMKRVEKTRRSPGKCDERDRLWASFLKVGKEWQSIQDKLRKTVKRKGILELDVVQLEDMKSRFEAAHKLFDEHIAKHGCHHGKSAMSKKRKSRK